MAEFQAPNEWIMDKTQVREAKRQALGLQSKNGAGQARKRIQDGDSSPQALGSLSNKWGAVRSAGMALTLLDLPAGFREEPNHAAAVKWFGVGSNPNTRDEVVAVYRNRDRQTCS